MIRNRTVGATAVELARPAQDRISISFGVGNTSNASSVMIRDGPNDATATEGFPLAFSGGMLTFTGQLATKRWTAIRLAAVDAVVAIVEEFLESPAKAPAEGIKL